jgi:hypothetical protein
MCCFCCVVEFATNQGFVIIIVIVVVVAMMTATGVDGNW